MPPKQVQVRLDPREVWLSIDALGFFGRWVRSPNGRWLLAHGQSHDARQETWSSDDPTGMVLLFDNGKEVVRLTGLSRPETVAISDSGVFVVYEWGPSGQFLGPLCQLRAFSADGQRITRQKPGAAIDQPALSPDGRYLAFHTLGAPRESPRPEDGESLFLLDLSGPAFVWQQPVPVVWPRSIRFEDGGGVLVVEGEEDETYRYSLKGDLLSAAEAERGRMKRLLADPRGYGLLDLAHARLEEVRSGTRPTGEMPEIEGFIRSALAKDISPNSKAGAHRVLGEIAEERGDRAAALAEYRAALELNPKIGLKKKVKALESH